jgi:hypothetical protein
MHPWFSALPFLHYLNFTHEEVYYSARFEKDTRYYVIRLEKDLFDYWIINAINGRIKSKLGQSRILAFPSFEEAFNGFCDMAKVRYQRHYHLKSFVTEAILLSQLMPFMPNKIHLKHSQEASLRKKITATSTTRPQKILRTNKEQKPAYEQVCFSF